MTERWAKCRHTARRTGHEPSETVKCSISLYEFFRRFPDEEPAVEYVETFRWDLDELVRRGAREGRRDGRREGQAMVLWRMIARRFGEETAGRVSGVLAGLPGPEGGDRVTGALFECGTGEEFVERLGTA